MHSIAALKNGFVTGLGLYNLNTGVIAPPATDPNNLGDVDVSHLSASFGLPEIIAQLTDYLGADLPAGFESAWLDYCYYYGAGAAEQTARYGESFGSLNLKQGHSRLTAYAAKKTGNDTLAARAWSEFLGTDGLAPTLPWSSVRVNGSEALVAVDEAAWVSTNDAALYGLAAIENLAQVGFALTNISQYHYFCRVVFGFALGFVFFLGPCSICSLRCHQPWIVFGEILKKSPASLYVGRRNPGSTGLRPSSFILPVGLTSPGRTKDSCKGIEVRASHIRTSFFLRSE